MSRAASHVQARTEEEIRKAIKTMYSEGIALMERIVGEDGDKSYASSFEETDNCRLNRGCSRPFSQSPSMVTAVNRWRPS